MCNFNNNDKTIAEQISRIKSIHSNFDVSFDRLNLKAIGEIQPTSRSDIYTIEIKYHFQERPEIRVLKPPLIVNWKGEKIPHRFQDEMLCLYRSKYGEFTYKKFIADTIIPWTALWLYHYENWHITGEWLGGGEHPEQNNSKSCEEKKNTLSMVL